MVMMTAPYCADGSDSNESSLDAALIPITKTGAGRLFQYIQGSAAGSKIAAGSLRCTGVDGAGKAGSILSGG